MAYSLLRMPEVERGLLGRFACDSPTTDLPGILREAIGYRDAAPSTAHQAGWELRSAVTGILMGSFFLRSLLEVPREIIRAGLDYDCILLRSSYLQVHSINVPGVIKGVRPEMVLNPNIPNIHRVDIIVALVMPGSAPAGRTLEEMLTHVGEDTRNYYAGFIKSAPKPVKLADLTPLSNALRALLGEKGAANVMGTLETQRGQRGQNTM